MTEKLTKDQAEFLDLLLAAFPAGAAYGPERERVQEVARPLVESGWVECHDHSDDHAVTEELGEGIVAYRLSEKMVEAFKLVAAERAEGSVLELMPADWATLH